MQLTLLAILFSLGTPLWSYSPVILFATHSPCYIIFSCNFFVWLLSSVISRPFIFELLLSCSSCYSFTFYFILFLLWFPHHTPFGFPGNPMSPCNSLAMWFFVLFFLPYDFPAMLFFSCNFLFHFSCIFVPFYCLCVSLAILLSFVLSLQYHFHYSPLHSSAILLPLHIPLPCYFPCVSVVISPHPLFWDCLPTLSPLWSLCHVISLVISLPFYFFDSFS